MEKERFIGMQNDFMFKAVLQSSQAILKNLLAALLEIEESEIKSCEVVNSIELGNQIGDKDCILDIKIVMNTDEIVDLELQMTNEHNWPERSLLYWSRAFDDLKVGEDYSLLKRTYHIGILDFTLFEDNPSFYSEYKVMDTKTYWVYSDKLNIRILDLSRVDEAHGADPRLVKWARILKATTYSELVQLAGEDRVFMELASHCRILSEDEKLKYQMWARQDYECRMTSNYNRGKRDGLQEGIAQGIEQGIEQGRALGLQESEAEIERLRALLAANGIPVE